MELSICQGPTNSLVYSVLCVQSRQKPHVDFTNVQGLGSRWDLNEKKSSMRAEKIFTNTEENQLKSIF